MNQEEYDKITGKQLKALDFEKKKEVDKKKMLTDHNQELRYVVLLMLFRRQIKEREEFENLKRREALEDGRKLKQKQIADKERIEDIKQKKIGQIKELNVAQKYLFDLEKFKII